MTDINLKNVEKKISLEEKKQTDARKKYSKNIL